MSKLSLFDQYWPIYSTEAQRETFSVRKIWNWYPDHSKKGVWVHRSGPRSGVVFYLKNEDEGNRGALDPEGEFHSDTGQRGGKRASPVGPWEPAQALAIKQRSVKRQEREGDDDS